MKRKSRNRVKLDVKNKRPRSKMLVIEIPIYELVEDIIKGPQLVHNVFGIIIKYSNRLNPELSETVVGFCKRSYLDNDDKDYRTDVNNMLFFRWKCNEDLDEERFAMLCKKFGIPVVIRRRYK